MHPTPRLLFWLLCLMPGLALATAGCGGDSDPDVDTEAAAEAPADEPSTRAGADGILVTGFSTPESVLHDGEADVYLVSNINGDPAASDGNGFISRVSPDGAVLELKWIDGAAEGIDLDAPKGMGLLGDTLFVSDIDEVRLFHRESGAALGSWTIDGAAFLNDIAVSNGNVYVTDSGVEFTPEGIEHTGSAAIHRFTSDGTHQRVEAGDVTGINGIATRGDDLYAVTSFGTGNVIGIVNGARVDLPALPGLSLDGVVAYADSALLISDWDTQAVYHLRANGFVSPVVRNVASPADIGYDPDRNRVLIPGFTTGQVLISPIP